MSGGSDWLLGDVGKKAEKKTKLAPGAITVTPDEIEAVLADSARDGKRLAGGIRAAVTALEQLKQSGLTGEALVVLVTEKCAWAKNGKRVSAETVQLVLEALFGRLGEYVR